MEVRDQIFCFEIARRSVGRAALHLGIDSMTEASLDVMADILLNYLHRVGKTLSHLVEASGRTSSHVNLLDAFQACQIIATPAVRRLHLLDMTQENNLFSSSTTAVAAAAAAAASSSSSSNNADNGGMTNHHNNHSSSSMNDIGGMSSSGTANGVSRGGGGGIMTNNPALNNVNTPDWKGLAAFLFGPKWLDEKEENDDEGESTQPGGGKRGPSSTAIAKTINEHGGWMAPYLDEVPHFPLASDSCANPHPFPLHYFSTSTLQSRAAAAANKNNDDDDENKKDDKKKKDKSTKENGKGTKSAAGTGTATTTTTTTTTAASKVQQQKQHQQELLDPMQIIEEDLAAMPDSAFFLTDDVQWGSLDGSSAKRKRGILDGTTGTNTTTTADGTGVGGSSTDDGQPPNKKVKIDDAAIANKAKKSGTDDKTTKDGKSGGGEQQKTDSTNGTDNNGNNKNHPSDGQHEDDEQQHQHQLYGDDSGNTSNAYQTSKFAHIIPSFYPPLPPMKVSAETGRIIVDQSSSSVGGIGRQGGNGQTLDALSFSNQNNHQNGTTTDPSSSVTSTTNITNSTTTTSSSSSDGDNEDFSHGVRSSLVELGRQTYWGSGWEATTTTTSSNTIANTTTATNNKKNVGVPLGRNDNEQHQVAIVPVSRASGSRVSRILEGSMDAAAML